MVYQHRNIMTLMYVFTHTYNIPFSTQQAAGNLPEEKLKILAVVFISTLLVGCAGGLNSVQKSELKSFQAKGLSVEEKNPGTGAALGILPGGGSFYTRNYGLGIVNLLFWPLSIFWDPVNGYEGALSINYYVTKATLARKMDKEIKDLEYQMQDKKITVEEFLIEKRKIEKKYSPDF